MEMEAAIVLHGLGLKRRERISQRSLPLVQTVRRCFLFEVHFCRLCDVPMNENE